MMTRIYPSEWYTYRLLMLRGLYDCTDPASVMNLLDDAYTVVKAVSDTAYISYSDACDYVFTKLVSDEVERQVFFSKFGIVSAFTSYSESSCT